MTKITQTPVLTTATDNQTYLLVIDNGITKRFNYKAFGEQFSTISKGDIGYMGSRGNQGYSGSIGYQGAQGNTGYMGSRGNQGFQGFQGYSGSIGYQGERGDTAYMGSRGSAGYFGSVGFTGSLGYFGSVGYVGSKGTDGTSVNIKGAVVNTINLPSSGNTLGDSYLVSSTGHLWIYAAASTPGSTNGFVDSGTLQGPQGYTGSFGSQGDQGFQGNQGYTGSSSIGGGFYSRTTTTGTTTSILNNDTDNISITGFKSYSLLKVQTSAAAWVRLYTTSAARTSDSSRVQTVDPTPGSGVIAEVITTGGQTQLITPAIIGFNNDTIPDNTIYLAVTNLSGSTAAITATLTLLQLEI